MTSVLSNTAAESLRKSGIAPVGEVAWGTHFCLFYETTDDLCDTVVPYFRAGLEKNELCFWLISDLTPAQCINEWRRRSTLDIGAHIANGSMIFQVADDWYRRDGVLDAATLRRSWDNLLIQSQERGFDGVRIAGCVTWLKESEWTAFAQYEREFEAAVTGKSMIVLCSYPLATTSAVGILDVAHSHDFALAKREGKWDVLETPALRLKQLGIRNRQRSAVAALGLAAIRNYDLHALLGEAVKLAAETLGTGRSIIWQLRPEQDDMIMRAQVGWDELPRDAAIPLVEGSASHYAFTHDEPVMVIDVENDPRFYEKSWVLRQYGVTTMINSLVRGHERPWGMLSVHSTTRHGFTDDDVEFLQSMANVLALAIERNEHELAERREKEVLQTIVDNIPVMIVHDDAAGHVISANPEWERTLGWTAAEARDVDIMAELFPDPDRLRPAREFLHGAPDHIWRDFQMRTRDGRFIETSWARFSLSDGSAMKFAIDVTERKSAEERFRQIAENIDETFCVFSADLEYLTYLNPAGERLLGRTRESLSARGAWIEIVHPDDRERTLAHMAGRRTAGPDEDCRILRPDGSMRWVSSRVSVLRGAGHDTNSICVVMQDMTVRREAEEERAELLRITEAALAKLNAIQSITDSALDRMSLDELLRELLARLRSVMAADHAVVLLLDEQRTSFTVRAVDGFPMARAAAFQPTLDSHISGRIVREGRPLIIENIESAKTSACHSLGLEIRAAMGAPLAAEAKIFGVVIVTSTADRHFTEDELDLLRMVADRVGPAIERGRLVETVRGARERLASLSRRLLSVQEEERRRLAIELHDELGQILTAVKLNLGAAPARLGDAINDAIENVDLAMRTVRDLALQLRPAMLDDLGLAAALRWYADRFAQQSGVQTHLSIAEAASLDSGIATACFRVAQEALTNVIRHARAANVWIELRHSTTELELSVRDDGIGFDVDAARERAVRGASLGLIGMEERVSLAGGFIEIHSAPGQGTEVRVLFTAGGGP